MPKVHICDNPHCCKQFSVDKSVVYCDDCQPIANEWGAAEKQEIGLNADAFIAKMDIKRTEFFSKRTPVTRKKAAPTPQARPTASDK